MNKGEFKDGIRELQNFFPALKPDAGQMRAWFERLEDFSVDAWRLAVYQMTEYMKVTPKYADIKEELIKAHNKINAPSAKVKQAQGFAPMSEAKARLCQEHMQQLLKVMSLPAIEQEAALADIKQMWANTYHKLPEYRSAREIQRMIDAEDWDRLVAIGFLEEAPKADSVFIPMFSCERTPEHVVEVAAHGN